MLKHLVEQARDMLDSSGEDTALIWLAVHAWYEGHIEGEMSVAAATSKGPAEGS